ncbi:hypothetical protein BV898_15999 [Hypsibius exemplaris]|uniref:C2H2-type domain-containing protein n=1 Tax=Hypsibius exemplaris TaxID=2072580 RepID=A0A9X6NCP8_HYPEX|nr:hypothetical protein BV898_15999 [Hypsibius exemplaris]
MWPLLLLLLNFYVDRAPIKSVATRDPLTSGPVIGSDSVSQKEQRQHRPTTMASTSNPESSSHDQPLDLSTKPRDSIDLLDVRRASSSSTEILQLLTKESATTKRHPCLACGIGFTSSRTLEAHQKSYCMKKPVEDPSTSSPVAPPTTLRHSSPEAEKRHSVTTTAIYTPEIPPSSEPASAPPTIRQRRTLKVAPPSMAENVSTPDSPKSGNFCPQCPFRANTLRGLRSHITKCHSKEVGGAGSGKAAVKLPRASNTGSSSRSSVIVAPKRPKIDGVCGGVSGGLAEKKKHCKYCDISFKYLSTFLAHRKYYCSVNKVGGEGLAKDGAEVFVEKS